MKSIHHLLQSKLWTASAALFLVTIFTIPVAASFQAQGYTTPSYIDFEVAEWTVSEANRHVELVVIRTGDFRQGTSIDFQTIEGTASEGRDYRGTGGTLVFEPLESRKTIRIGLLTDGDQEEDEGFSLKLTSADPNVVFLQESATVVLQDSPPAPPVLTIQPQSGGMILLSWEASSDCVLERASSVQNPSWEMIATAPELNGNRFEIREPITKPVFLYRLRQK